jgi:signal peptidase I
VDDTASDKMKPTGNGSAGQLSATADQVAALEAPPDLRTYEFDTVHGFGGPTLPPEPVPVMRPWLARICTVLIFGMLSLASYWLINRYVVTSVIIQGSSMWPTLKEGERYLLIRAPCLNLSFRRGDLVVIRDPGHSDLAVKRIVGVPDDSIRLVNGKVYLNNQRFEEQYLPMGSVTYMPELQNTWFELGKDRYFVLGDNRNNSEDSRYYGTIHRSQIVGFLLK